MELYAGLFAAGLQTAIVYAGALQRSPAELVERHPILIVPALYVTEATVLDALAACADGGGTW